MEQRQGVLAFADEANEVFGVLALVGLAALVMGEDEGPALAIDISRGMRLGEVATEAFGIDGVIVPGELAPGVLNSVGVGWPRAQQGSSGDQGKALHGFSIGESMSLDQKHSSLVSGSTVAYPASKRSLLIWGTFPSTNW